MSMTKEKAAEIIKFANNVYEMNFDREKAKLWLDMLSENGDYEPTMHTLKKYIKDGNPYPPKIPNIMRSYPKQLEHKVDEKTKEHQSKMANDPKYREERAKALQTLRNKMREFGGENYV